MKVGYSVHVHASIALELMSFRVVDMIYPAWILSNSTVRIATTSIPHRAADTKEWTVRLDLILRGTSLML